MGGSELVDRLRERLPEVPIVPMSGYSEEELAVGVRHKAAAFLEEPFSPETLTRTIREILDR
jgi:two-component system, cell cycle sensor histidine kinase and response regulator CckA